MCCRKDQERQRADYTLKHALAAFREIPKSFIFTD